MPIYEYECDDCGCRFEARQRFSDAPLTECNDDKCKGKVHKVFSPPAIIFKGSGFYVNDHGRGGSKASSSSKKPCEEAGSKDACSSCEKAKDS